MNTEEDVIPMGDLEKLGELVWLVFEAWKVEFRDPDHELLHRAFIWFEVDHEHFPSLAHFLANAIHPKRKPRNSFEHASRNLESFMIKLGVKSPRKPSATSHWMPAKLDGLRRLSATLPIVD